MYAYVHSIIVILVDGTYINVMYIHTTDQLPVPRIPSSMYMA